MVKDKSTTHIIQVKHGAKKVVNPDESRDNTIAQHNLTPVELRMDDMAREHMQKNFDDKDYPLNLLIVKKTGG